MKVAEKTMSNERFSGTSTYVLDSELSKIVNISMALEMPLLLKGEPGTGKTMLARRMPTILPQLTLYEALETTKIHSVSGILPQEASLIANRPFRALGRGCAVRLASRRAFGRD